MKINIPENANIIIEKLQNAGFEAFIVGGCVRDAVLMREPEDWDITTSAEPGDIKKLFDRTVDTGILHGTVTVLMGSEAYEVTTYRVDGKYNDSRHPESVEFTRNLLDDLKRRDFTINAMAYNDTTGLLDAFDGLSDLQNGIIKAVGIPEERFNEDALRIMRAARFAAQLGFRIEDKTFDAAVMLAPKLKNISTERIAAELKRLVLSDNPQMIGIMKQMGITDQVLPWYEEDAEALKALQRAPKLFTVRMAVLLRNKDAEAILRKLKLDNITIDETDKLVRFKDYSIEADEIMVRKALNAMGEDILLKSLMVREAFGGDKEVINKLRSICVKVVSEKQCYEIKTLAIHGNDIIALGMKPGPDVGIILAKLMELVIEDQSLNNKENLMEKAKELIFK